MQTQRFLSCLMFLVLCSSMVFDSIAVTPIEQFCELMSYPGWRGLPPLQIVQENRHNLLNIYSVLVKDDKGELLLTARNLPNRIRGAQIFLSCQYTIDFLIYQTYLYRLGTTCTFMTAYVHRECLQKFIELLNPETLISRMKSALSFFSFLITQTELKTAFFDILDHFISLQKLISLPNDGTNVDPYINDKLKNILIEFGKLENTTIKFFKTSCRPAALLKEKFGNSTLGWNTVDVKLKEIYYKEISEVEKMIILYPLINNAIKEFIEMDYFLMGFNYIKESQTTVLNKIFDPQTQITLTKGILNSLPNWSLYLENLMVVVNEKQYGLQSLIATEVNEQNIDGKIRLLYDLMSAYFVKTLRDLYLYYTLLSELYDLKKKPIEKYVFIESFVKAVKKSDPVIQYMKAANIFFQNISPLTTNLYISKILILFKSFVDITNFDSSELYSKTFKKYIVEQLFVKMESIKENMSKVKKDINEIISQMNPIVAKNLTAVVETSQTGIERQLGEEINLFIDKLFPALGFSFTLNVGLL